MFGEESYIFVYSPSHQWVFVDSPSRFDRTEFLCWLETTTKCSIIDSAIWPTLEIDREPPENWQALVLEMPCRYGQATWDLLTNAEFRNWVEGAGLPDDIEERRVPDRIE